MVIWFQSHNVLIADVEAEDIELGINEQELALDVDGDHPDEDPEGLDSDDDDVNAELGIDAEECDGKSSDVSILDELKHNGSSPNACRPSVLAFTERKTNASFRYTTSRSSFGSGINQRRGDLAYYP
jgi:hypothetical protein